MNAFNLAAAAAVEAAWHDIACRSPARGATQHLIFPHLRLSSQRAGIPIAERWIRKNTNYSRQSDILLLLLIISSRRQKT